MSKWHCNGKDHKPNCTCGFGGFGHTGRAFHVSNTGPSPTMSDRWKNDSNFCRLTTCPECGERRYLVAHSNGKFYLASPEWPFPLHVHCSPVGKIKEFPPELRLLLSLQQKRIKCVLGIIVQTFVQAFGDHVNIEIAGIDGYTKRVKVPSRGFDYRIILDAPGTLVMVAEKQRALFGAVLWAPTRILALSSQSPVAGLEPCVFCRKLVDYRELQNHLRGCEAREAVKMRTRARKEAESA